MKSLSDSERAVVQFVVKTADMLVVYDEFIDYKDPNGVSVMDNMSKNVFKKFKQLEMLIPRAIFDEVQDYYHTISSKMKEVLSYGSKQI